MERERGVGEALDGNTLVVGLRDPRGEQDVVRDQFCAASVGSDENSLARKIGEFQNAPSASHHEVDAIDIEEHQRPQLVPFGMLGRVFGHHGLDRQGQVGLAVDQPLDVLDGSAAIDRRHGADVIRLASLEDPRKLLP